MIRVLLIALIWFISVPSFGKDAIKTEWDVHGPIGYQIFCLNRKMINLCSAKTARKTQVPLRILEEVFNTWKTNITPRNDIGEKWELLHENSQLEYVGDCEDFVLTVQNELYRKGYALSAIRIAVGYVKQTSQQTKVGHAILMVKTDEGPRVVDIRQSRLTSLGEANNAYDYIAIQTIKNPREWVELH